MKKTTKIIAVSAIAFTLAAVPALSFAMPGNRGENMQGQTGRQGQMEMPMNGEFRGRPPMDGSEMPTPPDTQSGATQRPERIMNEEGQIEMPMNGEFKGRGSMTNTQAQSAAEPGEIVYSTLSSNSAESLSADYANAETIVMSDENNTVKIKESGTYIITGSASDGYIQVNKGVQDVVLVLKDLTLTGTSQATLSINKGAEAKIIVSGNVVLTDAETDTESENYDGAVIKAKAGSSTVLTGTGTLTLNGDSKQGIKVSGTDADDINDGYGDASFIIDGSLTINITATDDGINSGTDMTIKSGTVNVSAGDDGIKADYILTIGSEGTNGPTVNVSKAGEALEGATINILSGDITVNASDDGINAANSDLTDYTYSINVLGGNTTVSSAADGIDSNGNINLIAGKLTIAKSANNGGEGGMDYQGSYYISDDFTLDNPYGITMDSGMGQMGGGRMNGGMKFNRDNAEGTETQDAAPQGSAPAENKGGFFQRIINFFKR